MEDLAVDVSKPQGEFAQGLTGVRRHLGPCSLLAGPHPAGNRWPPAAPGFRASSATSVERVIVSSPRFQQKSQKRALLTPGHLPCSPGDVLFCLHFPVICSTPGLGGRGLGAALPKHEAGPRTGRRGSQRKVQDLPPGDGKRRRDGADRPGRGVSV